MRQILGVILFFVILCLLCSVGYGQVKLTPFATTAAPRANSYAYTNNGIWFDSTLRAIKYSKDSSHFLYFDESGYLQYAHVPTSGGAIDTSSLSNRINGKVSYSDTLTTIATKKNLKDTSAALRALISALPATDTTSLSSRINTKVDTISLRIDTTNHNIYAGAGVTHGSRNKNNIVIGDGASTADSNSTVIGRGASGGISFADNLPYSGKPTVYGDSAKGPGVAMGNKAKALTGEAVAVGPKTYAGGNATISIGDATASMKTNAPGLNLVMGDVDTIWKYVNACIQCGATHITTDFTSCFGCLGLYASDSTVGAITKRPRSLIFGGYYNSQNAADFNQNQGWFNNIQFGPDYTEFPHDSVYVRWAQSVSRQDAGYAYTRNNPGQAVMLEVPGGSGNAYGKGMYWTVSDTTVSGLDTQKTRHTAMGISGNGNFTTYFLDNYNSDVSSSYTSLSKISKGYADGRYGTLSQQNTNTTNIATNTASIAAINSNTITVTAGTSGSDFNVSGSPVSLGGTVTLNIPDASTTARGLITTGSQSLSGTKIFTNSSTTRGTGVSMQFGGSTKKGYTFGHYGANNSAMWISGFSGTTNYFLITTDSNNTETDLNASGTLGLQLKGGKKFILDSTGWCGIGNNTNPANGDKLTVNGTISSSAIGGSTMIKTNVNNQFVAATAGTDYPTILNATLSSGTVTVSDAAITASAKICGAMYATESGTIGTSFSYTFTAGVGYTITSSNVLDNSVISYMLKR